MTNRLFSLLMIGYAMFVVGCLFRNPWIGVPGFAIGSGASLFIARNWLTQASEWLVDQWMRGRS